MAQLILSKEEQEQMSRLLTEHNPERHPSTAPILELLSPDARETIVNYISTAQFDTLNAATAVKFILDGVELNGWTESKDLLHYLHDVLLSVNGAGDNPYWSEYERVMHTLAHDSVGSIQETLSNLITAPAMKLLEFEEREAALPQPKIEELV